MMQLSLAANVTGGNLQGVDVNVSRVVTDSRSIRDGDLFVALNGDRFDGHDFVTAASAAGAVGAMVSHAVDVAVTQLQVRDTTIALGQLAASWRRRFNFPVVAVTGSNGKTTVKQMIGAILAQQKAGFVAPGNLNNHIGLPLSLLSLRDSHEFAVLEMGMNHAGEIGYLTSLARPNIALITNAAPAHLEGLGSIENIAHAKAEIFQGLAADGVAIINADDVFASQWRGIAGTVRSLTFGIDQSADVQGKIQPTQRSDAEHTHFSLLSHKENQQCDIDIHLPLMGEHNVRNALAAGAVAISLNVAPRAIKAGLESLTPVKGRLQKRQLGTGVTLIDDTYNANPASFQAGINVLATARHKRILVMGDMAELGTDASQHHASVGEYAKSMGIDNLLALGPLSTAAVNKFGDNAVHFKDLDSLMLALRKQLKQLKGATILVKGSRSMQMERVVDTLLVDSRKNNNNTNQPGH